MYLTEAKREGVDKLSKSMYLYELSWNYFIEESKKGWEL